MKITAQQLRENAIAFFNGKSIEQSLLDKNFIDYINAYCFELKKTEWDVLYNDETYDIVFSIFNSISIKEKQLV
jgi:hypothetical protein